MHWSYSNDIWLFAAGALLTLFLVLYAWTRNEYPSVPYFIMGTSLVFLWCVLSCFELSAIDLRLREGISNAMYFPITFTCVLWLLFALSFSRREGWLNWKFTLVVCLIPFITSALALTNSLHGFMFGPSTMLVKDHNFVILKEYRFWFWVHTVYSYGIVLIGSFFVVFHVFRKEGIYRQQGFVMVAGATIPFVANLLFLILRDNIIYVDITPIAMALASAFFAWGLFKYRLFDLVPIARANVFDCLDDPVFILDTQYRIVATNPAGASFVNQSREQLVGQLFSGLMPSTLDIFQAGIDTDREMSLPSEEGPLYYTITSKTINSSTGDRLGFLISLHNITSLKRHQVALTNAKEEAEEATAIKSEFLATMSHEIRSPMNGVLGFTSLLLDTPLDSEQKSYVETIRNSGKKLLNVINAVLDYSKLEAGKIEIEYRPFLLYTSVEEALDAIAKPAFQKGLELAFSIDSNVPLVVKGDSTRLYQVLMNLLSNAVKFTESGEITVHVTCAEIPVDEHTPYVLQFVVQDTGIGIPEEKLSSIFDSFTQADSSTTRRFGGSGLGLSISRRLCEMMGGHIFASSVEGKGSTFGFTLSVKEVLDHPVLKGNNTFNKSMPGYRVLIASTNFTRKKHLHDLCRSWGLHTHVASSVQDVITLLEYGRVFDALLIDHIPYSLDTKQLIHTLGERGIEWPLFLLLPISVSHDALHPSISEVLHKPIKRQKLYDALLNHLVGVDASSHIKMPLFDDRLGVTHPLHILIAEDDKINQELALLLFSRLGYTPDLVSNGREAIEAARQSNYDVIFMDIYMPEVDGITASKSIKEERSSLPCPPIVAMTASVTPNDRKRCTEANMDGFLSKPIDMNQLAKTLRYINRTQKSTKSQPIG